MDDATFSPSFGWQAELRQDHRPIGPAPGVSPTSPTSGKVNTASTFGAGVYENAKFSITLPVTRE